MPYLRFPLRILFSFCVLVAIAMFSAIAHSAEWPECERAKLRELKLQQGSSASKTTKSKKQKSESRSERIEEIDTWLWKNCREFSYELRQLEQDKM